MSRGIALYNKGRYESALAEFRRLIRNAGTPEAFCFLAHSLNALGRRREALLALSRLLKVRPDHVPALVAKGEFLATSGKLNEAQRAFERAAALAPQDSALRARLSQIFCSLSSQAQQRGKTREAVEWLERSALLMGRRGEALLQLAKLLQIPPDHILALAAKGELRTPGRKSGEAQRVLSAPAPKDTATRSRLAQAFRSLSWHSHLEGMEQEAEQWLERAARLEGIAPRVFRNVSERNLGPLERRFRHLMRSGRFPAAFTVAECLLDAGAGLNSLRLLADPWMGETEVEHLKVLGGLRSPKQPWTDFYIGSLSQDPKRFGSVLSAPRLRYGWMLQRAGAVSLRAGDFKEAISLLKAAPIDWRAYGFLAEAYLCLGRRAAAQDAISRTVAKAPELERGEAMAWRGELDLWLGNYQQALRELKLACAFNGRWGWCWKGATKVLLGRPHEALRDLDEAIRICPEDREAYVWRGEANRILGRHRAALRDLSREPVGLWGLVNRALVWAALGDRTKFRRDFAAVPDVVHNYARRRARAKSPEAVLKAALKLARGYRRDDYHQAIWMR